ncbi:MAG: aminomethyl-transferring glycine dehydrogenase subunit GcvPB, partial [Candidatus Hydrothermota bacterium]
MKYNPKINEELARLSGFLNIHPLQPEASVQGALRLMKELEELLKEISGFDAVSLQPAAGAHGELTGMMLVRKYHEMRGNPRKYVLIPDSAHGTNPASVTLSGYSTKTIKSNDQGLVDPEVLRQNLSEDVAAFMVTNPNTLGLFESEIIKISEMVHDVGALMYMDGANLNALLGIVRPGDVGFDIMHFNLHKTFSTPHGGGGPGSGPVGVKKEIEPYLPVPRIVEDEGLLKLSYDFPDSIGKVHAFFGNFNVMVKAYVYIRMMGPDGLRKVAEGAVINANYLRVLLQEHYDLPYKRTCMHEFVLSGRKLKKHGVRTLDVAKRLLDYGFHAPTVYFPLIVPEALMIEPTETETKETLDAFAEAMIKIKKEAEENPDLLHEAPHVTPVRRLDEARAARELNVRWRKED